MAAFALVVGLAAMIAAALPSPGLFVAIGLGLAAAGTGWLGYRRTADPGFRRLAGAAAITLGAMAGVLGVVRVVLVLAALGHLERLIG
ncbi:MAG TPA: hypothetical protein VGC42_16800 [Kofleriaceae bacterium]